MYNICFTNDDIYFDVPYYIIPFTVCMMNTWNVAKIPLCAKQIWWVITDSIPL